MKLKMQGSGTVDVAESACRGPGRHESAEKPCKGARRRGKALSPEGYRARAGRHDPESDLGWRWAHVRCQAA